MLLNWASVIDCYTILCAVVSGISAFVASLIALKGEAAGRYKYALLLLNTAVAISFGLASNFHYKFGGGFDCVDTKMAFGVYGATAFTLFYYCPCSKPKRPRRIPFTVWAILWAAIPVKFKAILPE